MNNKLRNILNNGDFSVATRIASSWPIITEIACKAGGYDYIEFLAEYSPYTVLDFENLARTCELYGVGSIVKVDFQNSAYVAQKALAAGIQGVLFTDCKTMKEVEECIKFTMPDTLEDKGSFGYPNYRWIGYNPDLSQLDYAEMVRNTVRLFMIEKKEAVANIEEICKVPGVDMIQFGPSDYSMSCGKNMEDNLEDCRLAEEYCIEVALAHGVMPRCEINDLNDAQYYRDLGVKHFCVGDQIKILKDVWTQNGEYMKKFIR